MHQEHGIFEIGTAQYKKIRLHFFADESHRDLICLCAPLYFSRGRADKNEPDCYYFWDFEAKEGRNFLALKPSEIVAMELMEDTFSLQEIHRTKLKTEHSMPNNG